MPRHTVIELSVSVFTLLVSFYIAFGPLRHRLPRFITRFAKYSAGLKLLALSGLCWFALYQNVHVDGPRSLRWMLTALAIAFIGGAVFVLTRKTPVVKVQTEQEGKASDGRA